MHQRKVLIVEDNELNLKLFYDLLSMKKLEVISCKDGHKALGLVEEEMPDLILMDIQLNGISGIDLIKTIKQNKDTQKIPIIAITAFAMKQDEARIMGAGSDMYLSKPVSIDKFFDAVNCYINLNEKETV